MDEVKKMMLAATDQMLKAEELKRAALKKIFERAGVDEKARDQELTELGEKYPNQLGLIMHVLQNLGESAQKDGIWAFEIFKVLPESLQRRMVEELKIFYTARTVECEEWVEKFCDAQPENSADSKQE